MTPSRIIIVFAFLTAIFAGIPEVVWARTNISTVASDHWGWNDVVGWIRFNTVANTMNVYVSSQQIEGYATSSAGEISLDCTTSPSGDICGTSNYKVTNVDGLGSMEGWGWNDSYGWISFCGRTTGGTPNCPTTTVAYQTVVDGAGEFTGYAWNDLIGWVVFNCLTIHPTYCGTSDFRVETSWIATSTGASLESATYDTGSAGGAKINAVTIKGEIDSVVHDGARVYLQFAGSNSSSGPWTYVGPSGYGSYYSFDIANVNSSTPVQFSLHNDERYFRYRLELWSSRNQQYSPRVDDVVINWSP